MMNSSGLKNGGSQEFELNLASIIDCFTVLIIYLLISASFISFGFFDVSTASQGNPDQGSQGAAATELGVELKDGFAISVNVVGASGMNATIPAKDGAFDYQSLTQTLEMIRKKHPQVEVARLSASGEVPYHNLVKAVEATRKAIPNVSLGD